MMTARERLLEAARLIESVIADLDTSIIDCPCPDHVRHFANWPQANLHPQLESQATKLRAWANGGAIGEVDDREPRQRVR